jgi:hypothetical protein
MSQYSILQKFKSGVHFIMMDAKQAEALMREGNKRLICVLNDSEALHCAIMPKKEGGFYISIGQRICKKWKLKEGIKVKATFSIDKSQYQFEIPKELVEVLNSDPKANKVFHSLTKGNQRGLIYLVNMVKSSDKKIERALKITDSIKKGITSQQLVLK